MRRLAVLAVAPPADRAAPTEAKVTCDSGTTAFVDGNLRIFGIHFRTPDEWGFDEYACLGRRRPLEVGGVGVRRPAPARPRRRSTPVPAASWPPTRRPTARAGHPRTCRSST